MTVRSTKRVNVSAKLVRVMCLAVMAESASENELPPPRSIVTPAFDPVPPISMAAAGSLSGSVEGVSFRPFLASVSA